MENKYYYCTKFIRFPIKDVIQKIYDYYNQTSRSSIDLSDIYDYLREQFNVKSFNRSNLIELLGSSGEIIFNVIKDLYVKHVVENIKEEKTDYSVLRNVFIKNRTCIIDSIKVLGLDALKDILSNGISRWNDFLNQLLQEDVLEIKTTEANHLVRDFIVKYEESELLNLLQNETSITEEIEQYITDIEEQNKTQQFRDNINFRLKYVHTDNLDLSVQYLFVGTVSQILSKNNIKTVNELRDLTIQVLIELQNHQNIIINRLKTLQFSLKEKFNEEFKLLVQQANKQNKPNRLWENYVSILKNRAQGKTLEASGQHLGITRERVRQLECKYFELFNKFHQKMIYPVNFLRAMVEDKLFVQDSDIIKIFPFNPLLYKYFLLPICSIGIVTKKNDVTVLVTPFSNSILNCSSD